MAKTTADLWFRFFSDTKGLEKGSRQATRDLSATEKAAGKAKRGFSDMQKALGAIGLALGAREIAGWAIEAGKMSESARIAGESADKVLGPAAQGLRDDFEELRKTMGFNSGEFDQLIAKQGLLVTGMDVGKESAGEYIGQLVTLGGDLATFSGDVGRTEDAIDAVTAAIRGEFDPLEQWGVKLSESKIKAEIARREGIDPLFASMSEGEKRMIVITDLINQAAAPAIGSLGDAADTAAGKQNNLNAALEDLQIELGQYVTPELEAFYEIAIEAAEAMQRAADDTSTWQEKLGALADVWDALVGDMGITFAEIREEWAMWKAAIEKARDAIYRLWVQIKRLPSSIPNPFAAWRMPSIRLPGFATGTSRVPGRPGEPTLAVVHGGEEISNASQQATRGGGGGGGGGAGAVNIYVDATLSDPQAIASKIVDLLSVYNRTNGALPVVVRGGIG